MAKLYKCYNCDDPKRQVPGRDFTADKPVCPECGLDGSDPIVAHRIVERRVIHFEPPHPVARDCGMGKIACGCPGAGKQVTRSIGAANCPACLASTHGQKALAALEGREEVPNPADFAVSVQTDQYVRAEG